jgi:hypothetical protein
MPAEPKRPVWSYDIEAGDELSVDATFAAGGSDELRIDEDTAPFVHDVAYAAGSRWLPAPALPDGIGSGWAAPCGANGCRVKYRFSLHDAAAKLDAADTAIASGDVVVAPPSSWLLRPEGRPGRFRFHVRATPPALFEAGTHPSPDGAAATYEASTDALEASSFAVFGSFHAGTIGSGSARVEVAIAPQGLALADGEVLAWVRSAVEALATYFGRFPAPRTLVIVQAGKRGPTRGLTLGDGGPAVLVRVGDGVTARAVRDDWVVTHELIHVTLPALARQHVWFSEGLASYVEPIVRARARLLAPEKLWKDLVDGLPQGLPLAGDEGLDRTHTWGRTYWGGALFCLVADVTIRERTGNSRSLDDALRAISATGADVEEHWEIDRVLDVGDRATGTTVLRDLYRAMGLAAGSVDLAGLWSRLGVRASAAGVTFDEHAPLAAVRRGIAGR